MSNPEDIQLSLGDHLEELRFRIFRILVAIFVGFFICFYFSNGLMTIVMEPLLQVLEDLHLEPYLIQTSAQEKFISYMKISLCAAIVLVSPYILYQLWAFVGIGLYSAEKRFLLTMAPISLLNFLAGILFFYFLLMPLGLYFLLSFGSDDLSQSTVRPMIRISDHLSFSLFLSLVTGLVFEVPLIMLCLVRLSLVDVQFFIQNRRLAILCCFVLAAVLTPPDVATQLLMAIPLLSLYEIGIVICKPVKNARDAQPRWMFTMLMVPLAVLGFVSLYLYYRHSMTSHQLVARLREQNGLTPAMSASLLSSRQVPPPLLDSLLRHPETQIRLAALQLLALHFQPSPDLLRTVILRIQDPDPAVAMEAIVLAATWGDFRGGGVLETFLQDPRPIVRFLAGEAMRRMTGLDFGYAYEQPKAERRQSLDSFNAWLGKKERALSLGKER